MSDEYIVVGLGKSNLAVVDFLLAKGIVPAFKNHIKSTF